MAGKPVPEKLPSRRATHPSGCGLMGTPTST